MENIQLSSNYTVEEGMNTLGQLSISTIRSQEIVYFNELKNSCLGDYFIFC